MTGKEEFQTKGKDIQRYIIRNLVSLTEMKSSGEVQHNNDYPQPILHTRRPVACPGKKTNC